VHSLRKVLKPLIEDLVSRREHKYFDFISMCFWASYTRRILSPEQLGFISPKRKPLRNAGTNVLASFCFFA